MNSATMNFPKNAAGLLQVMRSEGVVGDRAPIDVDGIAAAMHVAVRYDHSLDRNGIIGQITFEDDNPVVTINPLQNAYEPRRRFTLAHELGHFVLHSANGLTEFIDSQKTMSRKTSYWNLVESEANSFGAQLLMPKDLIVTEGQAIIDAYKSRHDFSGMPEAAFTQAMAACFIVSNQAMEYRLRSLGVLYRSC